MRREFANICNQLVKDDENAVVLIGDISHYKMLNLPPQKDFIMLVFVNNL